MTRLTPMPETVIEEGPFWTIAVNRNQNLLGKTMLVLRRPCTAVAELTADEWASLHPELGRLVDTLSALYQPDQFNFAFLMNQDAQVHMHVLPATPAPGSGTATASTTHTGDALPATSSASCNPTSWRDSPTRSAAA